MIVKHIGADGRVRRQFESIHSIYQHDHNHIVTVNRVQAAIEPVDTSNALPTAYMRNWSFEYPVAIIHLAEGESVERVEDEPTRA